MINNEWQKAIYTEFIEVPDSYGQQHKSIGQERNIEVVVKNYNRTNVNDPRFIEVTDIALTKEKELKPGNNIIINNNKYYILFIIYSNRLNQLLLKQYA